MSHRRVNRRTAAAAFLAATVVMTTACTVAVEGNPLPAGTAAGYGTGPRIPEEPAVWASSELDPCLLLQGAAVTAAGPAFVTTPHNCALDYSLPDGRTDRLVVRVGTAFGTPQRAAAAPTTVGGLTAYQSREIEGGELDPPSCRVDIPLSATRSVQVEAISAGGDVDPACAGVRAAAEPLAAKLANPAALARTSPPTSLGHWHACALLEAAVGPIAPRGSVRSPGADECVAAPPNGDATGPNTQVVMTTGPDRLEEPAPTDTLIQLPMGPALQSPYPPHCRITFVAERLPGAPAELAAHIVEITRHNSPDACGDAVAAASKIQDALAAPAPAPPPAPARLGFAAGEPDDVMPVACGVFANTTPATCRAPRPVGVPHGARAVLGAGSFGPIAPDVSCAVLREAAAPVVGEVALAASGESRCIGLTDDGYAVHLGFFDRASVEEYCTSGDLGRMPVQVAGRDGIVCAPSPRAYGLVLPATGTAANTPGVLLVDGILNHPRGTLVTTPPADEARVRDLTTRIAEAAITRFLAS